jgi:hypothetical protein
MKNFDFFGLFCLCDTFVDLWTIFYRSYYIIVMEKSIIFFQFHHKFL